MPRKAKPTTWLAVEPNIEQRGDLLRVRMRPHAPAYFPLSELDAAREQKAEWQIGKRRGRRVLSAAERKMTVGQVARLYLDGNASSWRHRTQCQYEANWAAMAPTFGAEPVASLRASQVSDWLAAECAAFAPNTVSNRLWLLRSILDRAAADLDIPNVARLVKRSRKVGGKRRQKRVLSRTELTKLLAAADPRYRIVWVLMIALGLRSGEVRGLTFDRVDPDAGTIAIDRQLLRTHGDAHPGEDHVQIARRLWLAPLKAENSYAVLGAGPSVLAAIEQHIDDYGQGPAGLIVSGQRGQALSDERWIKEVKRVSDATGIAMVGHDLRRTFGHHVLAGDESNIDKVAGALRNDVNTCVKAYLRPDKTVVAYGDSLLDAVSDAAARTSRARGHLRAV